MRSFSLLALTLLSLASNVLFVRGDSGYYNSLPPPLFPSPSPSPPSAASTMQSCALNFRFDNALTYATFPQASYPLAVITNNTFPILPQNGVLILPYPSVSSSCNVRDLPNVASSVTVSFAWSINNQRTGQKLWNSTASSPLTDYSAFYYGTAGNAPTKYTSTLNIAPYSFPAGSYNLVFISTITAANFSSSSNSTTVLKINSPPTFDLTLPNPQQWSPSSPGLSTPAYRNSSSVISFDPRSFLTSSDPCYAVCTFNSSCSVTSFSQSTSIASCTSCRKSFPLFSNLVKYDLNAETLADVGLGPYQFKYACPSCTNSTQAILNAACQYDAVLVLTASQISSTSAFVPFSLTISNAISSRTVYLTVSILVPSDDAPSTSGGLVAAGPGVAGSRNSGNSAPSIVTPAIQFGQISPSYAFNAILNKLTPSYSGDTVTIRIRSNVLGTYQWSYLGMTSLTGANISNSINTPITSNQYSSSLTLMPNTLPITSDVNFFIQVTFTPFASSTVTSTTPLSSFISLQYLIPPSNGSCSVDTLVGTASTPSTPGTTFTLTCSSWTGSTTLSYTFGYSSSSKRDNTNTIADRSTSATLAALLGPGDPNNNYTATLFALISDENNLRTKVIIGTVQVFPVVNIQLQGLTKASGVSRSQVAEVMTAFKSNASSDLAQISSFSSLSLAFSNYAQQMDTTSAGLMVNGSTTASARSNYQAVTSNFIAVRAQMFVTTQQVVSSLLNTSSVAGFVIDAGANYASSSVATSTATPNTTIIDSTTAVFNSLSLMMSDPTQVDLFTASKVLDLVPTLLTMVVQQGVLPGSTMMANTLALYDKVILVAQSANLGANATNVPATDAILLATLQSQIQLKLQKSVSLHHQLTALQMNLNDSPVQTVSALFTMTTAKTDDSNLPSFLAGATTGVDFSSVDSSLSTSSASRVFIFRQTNFTQNAHPVASNATFSATVSVSIATSKNIELPISNTSALISILVPSYVTSPAFSIVDSLTFSASFLTFSPSRVVINRNYSVTDANGTRQVYNVSALPICSWWDTSALNWSTSGCVSGGASGTFTVCNCNHLTDFGLQFGSPLDFVSVVPDPPSKAVFTLQDFLNNVPMTVLLSLICVAYIVGMIGLSILDYRDVSKSSKEFSNYFFAQPTEALDPTSEIIRAQLFSAAGIRALFSNRSFRTKFISTHLWISLFFDQTKTRFLRAARFTVLMCVVLGNLAIVTMTFVKLQDSVKSAFMRLALGVFSSLVCFSISVPAVLMFSSVGARPVVGNYDPRAQAVAYLICFLIMGAEMYTIVAFGIVLDKTLTNGLLISFAVAIVESVFVSNVIKSFFLSSYATVQENKRVTASLSKNGSTVPSSSVLKTVEYYPTQAFVTEGTSLPQAQRESSFSTASRGEESTAFSISAFRKADPNSSYMKPN